MSNAATHQPEPAMRRVCMYCRAVMAEGNGPDDHAHTSHGVCPACLAKSPAELDRMARECVRPDTFLDSMFAK
jgi:hypothetical protein